MTNVFIVDDHVVLREALRRTLEDEADLSVCGEAASASAALEALMDEGEGPEPDVVLVDVAMPGKNGIELTSEFQAARTGLQVLMLSGHGEKSYVEEAREAGACGYVLKGKRGRVLSAIRTVADGGQSWPESLS